MDKISIIELILGTLVWAEELQSDASVAAQLKADVDNLSWDDKMSIFAEQICEFIRKEKGGF